MSRPDSRQHFHLRSLASIVGFALVLACATARASIHLPNNMNRDDRTEALRIVGLGSGAKLLSDPYPLGGYAGIEAGLSVENLPAEDLGRLGDGLSSPQQEVNVPQLTLGKGLYGNVDVFIQFTPYTRENEIARYGGIVRWGFYQSSTLPLGLSLNAHFSSANIANQMFARAYGADLTGGVNVENVSLYAGIGAIEAAGTFGGGQSFITDSHEQENETVSCLHSVIGTDVRFGNVFVALEIDRYTQAVFSGKLGFRY